MSRAICTSACLLALSASVFSLGGCAPGSSSAPLQTPRSSPSSLPQAPLGSASASDPSGSKPSSWIAQAWQGWQRAQKNPSRVADPNPRLSFGAPAPLPAPFSVALSPDLPIEQIDSLGRRPFESGELPFGAQLSPLPVAPFVSGADLWVGALAIRAGASADAGVGSGVAIGDWSALQRRMETRQVVALQGQALRLATLRQGARGDEERLLRADLQLDLDRLGRLDLDALIPALPGVEADRLRDLRLKLLSALALAPGQKQAAQDERLRIETEIRALLREQELARRGLIQKLQREVPAQIKSQRSQQIQRALAQLQASDAQAIARGFDLQQRRVRRDFSVPARLGIASAPAPSTSRISFNANYLRTFAGVDASLAPITRPQAPSTRPRASGVAVGARAALPMALVDLGRAVVGGGASDQKWRALLRKRDRAWKAPVR